MESSLSNKPPAQWSSLEAAFQMNDVPNEFLKYSSGKKCFVDNLWKSNENHEPFREFILTSSQ